MSEHRGVRRFARLLGIAVLIEAAAVLVLVAVVAVLGPADPEGAQAFAQRLGDWVGPIAGFVLCFGGGWFVSRTLTSGHVPRGLLLGALVAAIDVAILVASGSPFRWLFVVSNLGRLIAGALGGLVASRRLPVPQSSSSSSSPR
jgi:hypothetical protein